MSLSIVAIDYFVTYSQVDRYLPTWEIAGKALILVAVVLSFDFVTHVLWRKVTPAGGGFGLPRGVVAGGYAGADEGQAGEDRCVI